MKLSPWPRLAQKATGVFALLATILLAPHAQATIVRFDTSMGAIDVRLYPNVTPNSVANFLNYATTDRYDDTFIHRVPQSGGSSADFVVQGGGFEMTASIFDAQGIVTDPPIADEFNFSNTRGTLSFAKNSLGATSQWFFNIGNNSGLDFQGFTVFGRVVGDGMTVVDAINDLDTIAAVFAEDAPGEDFDELPVVDIDKVLAQNNVLKEDVVTINSVDELALPVGDYNFDGVVDAADYTVWRDSLGSTTIADADGNGDGTVDQADYDLWANAMSAPAASSVPEPSTALLLSAGIVSAIRRRSFTERV